MSTYSQENGFDQTSRSFWEIGQYQRTVKRMENGHKLSNELILLIQERSDIEKKYAKSLKHWSKRWNELIEKGAEYGTTKSAWKAVLTEADRKAELHSEIDQKLNADVMSSIKNWQKENYHKKMMSGFKETFEAEEGFKKAQKPWAKLYTKAQTAKKGYHSSVKSEKTATLQETSANGDSAISPDQVKKLHDKVEKCRQESMRTKDKYEKALDEVTTYNPRYMEDMKGQFDRTQSFERRRLEFFKETLLSVQRVLDLSVNPSFAQVYVDFHNSLQNADAEKDLKWWKNNNGTGMSMNWPVFEEYTDEMHAISSKKSKGNIGGSGGENVAIHTYRSTSEYSNQDYDQGIGDSSQSYPGYYQHSDYDFGMPADDFELDNKNPFAESLNQEVTSTPFDDDDDDEYSPPSEIPNGGVRVRALYDYNKVEDDELSFKQGDELLKLTEEDEQGWCRGKHDGIEGLYPANYVEEI
ncbi:protein kinase C and casein kinase substrate in neurons protein 1-like isoform X3 [Lytechinus variegatus]|uniref:protein kinase C and casein kinase substrate in neurons protein 1-like isoform X3 n=1 Tax=Lytechinus variegatus TaxID=7654 RepID=UPI001BB1789F|nr:protein kinase C and casein kinase substrate in neurons protein 1-like isoform X3 [Lytechinus variegatus]